MPIASDVTEESLIEMASASVDSACLLADCGVDAILYGCTSGSFIKGIGFDKKVEEDIRAATGIRTVSTSGCVLDALRRAGAARVAVYTPYIEEVNERARTFLEDNGFEVTSLCGLGLIDNIAVGEISPAEVFKMVFEDDRGGADLVFVSCTNLRTFEIIAPLSEVLGIPVVTSNQASLHGALRALGWEDLSEIGFIEP
jgi:maleate isomerase